MVPGRPLNKFKGQMKSRSRNKMDRLQAARYWGYQDWIARKAREAMEGREILTGRLIVSVMVYGPIVDERMPDADNLAKAPLDAMKGIVYHDDKQINLLVIGRQEWNKRPPEDDYIVCISVQRIEDVQDALNTIVGPGGASS